MTTKTKSRCRIMSPDHGDLEIEWDQDNPDEVEMAKDAFNKWKKKGYWAYKLDDDGSTGEVIHEFDPSAEAMVLAPRSAGG